MHGHLHAQRDCEILLGIGSYHLSQTNSEMNLELSFCTASEAVMNTSEFLPSKLCAVYLAVDHKSSCAISSNLCSDLKELFFHFQSYYR